MTSFDDFLQKTVSGSYLTMLGNAGYTGVGAGSATTGAIDNVALPSDLLDSQIQSYLQSAIANQTNITSGHVQANTSNALYVVYVQDNVVVDFGNGENSTNAFLAYHSSFTASNGQLIRYAVVPFHGTGGNAQNPWLGAFDSMTDAASHEIAEAATDPDGFTWFDRYGYEIGDTVAGSTVYLNGYAVQREGSIPGSIFNYLPMTPTGATASHQVAFTLSGGVVYEFSAAHPNGAALPTLPSGLGVRSISDQGIDDFGQPMIDVVDVGGNAYEYHDFADTTVPTYTANAGYFPYTPLGSGVKQAVAGQGVSYVLFTNSQLKEYVDPNYYTYYAGYGVNPAGRGGVIASGVLAISAGTDKIGANSVDYATTVNGKTALYEWRDVIARSTQLASSVTTFSAGQQGVHAYGSGNNAVLVREAVGTSYTSTGFTATTVTSAQPGSAVTSVVVGVNATGGFELVVRYGTNAYVYNNSTTASTLLGSNVGALSKSINGLFRVLTTPTGAFEIGPDLGTHFWTDTTTDSAVA
jgi:hypothetical protein